MAGRVAGAIGPGLVLLLGVGQADNLEATRWLADKIAGLRIFPNADDKLNLSVGEVGGVAPVVNQFTLWGDCAKGRRPSFARAAGGEQARPLYEVFVARQRELGLTVANREVRSHDGRAPGQPGAGDPAFGQRRRPSKPRPRRNRPPFMSNLSNLSFARTILDTPRPVAIN